MKNEIEAATNEVISMSSIDQVILRLKGKNIYSVKVISRLELMKRLEEFEFDQKSNYIQ